MDELIRWTDGDPHGRLYEITFDNSRPKAFRVRVWGKKGVSFFEGDGHSLNFAAVRALIAYDAAPDEGAP